MGLYPYQKKGAGYLARAKRAALFWGMGCGKTIAAVAAIDLVKPKNVLLILPASLKFNWSKEVRKWGRVRTNYTVVSYNYLQKEHQAKELGKREFDLCICDEAHAFKSWEAKQTLNYFKYVYRKCKRIWFLTGTPSTRSAEDYHSLFSMLEPGVHGKFKHWRERYCYKRYFGFGKYRRTQYYGYRNTDEIRTIARRVGWVLKLRDVVKELPDIRFSTFNVDVRASRDVEKASIRGQKPPEELLPALQELGINKAKASLEWLAEFNERVVVFAYFRSTIRFLEDSLGKRVVGRLTGAETDRQKQNAIEKFYACKKGFLLANLLAGSTGHNLQCAAVCVFIELPWSPAIFSQAYHRVYRIGQNSKVNVYSVLSRGTYDDRLLKILKEKSVGQDKVLAT